MATELQEVMLRIAAVCKDALSGQNPIARVQYPFATDTFPYFSIRLQGIQRDSDTPQDMGAETYTIVVRMVIAHIDAGYDGKNAENLHGWVEDVIRQFDRNPLLTSTTYTTPANITAIGPIVRSTGPVSGFQAGGLHSTQLGIEFTLRYQQRQVITGRIP